MLPVKWENAHCSKLIRYALDRGRQMVGHWSFAATTVGDSSRLHKKSIDSFIFAIGERRLAVAEADRKP